MEELSIKTPLKKRATRISGFATMDNFRQHPALSSPLARVGMMQIRPSNCDQNQRVTPVSKIGEAKKKIIHFYCYICKDYELKTSPHYRAQKQRFARRRKAEKGATTHGNADQQ